MVWFIYDDYMNHTPHQEFVNYSSIVIRVLT